MKTRMMVTGPDGEFIEQTVSELAPHSIELSRNSKGQYSWTVKVYFMEERKSDIVEDLESINNQLMAKFQNPEDEVEKIKNLMDKKEK